MLQGIDISHWNRDYLVRDSYRIFDNVDFVIFKATEGLTFKDRMLDNYISIYLSRHKSGLMGFYHYARPEVNKDATKEAKHFLEVVRPYIGRAILALDVEGNALRYQDLKKWVVSWVKYIKDETGVTPLIYCSESACTRIASDDLMKLSAGLWCARYNKNEPRKSIIKPWKFFAIWQYTSHPLDGDVFNGNEDQFKKYMLPKKQC